MHQDGNENVLYAFNMSYFDVLLQVDFTVTIEGTLGDTASATAYSVQTEAAVTAGDTAHFLMWMEPNRDLIGLTEGDDATDAEFVGVGQVIPFGINEETISVFYRLGEIEHEQVIYDINRTTWEVIVDNVRVPGAPNRHGTAFSFGGIFNSGQIAGMDAVLELIDLWAENEISILVEFHMEELDMDDTVLATPDPYVMDGTLGDVLAYGMLAGGATVEFNGESFPASPTLIPMPYQFGGGGIDYSVIGEWLLLTGWGRVPSYMNINGAWVAPTVTGGSPNVIFDSASGNLLINIGLVGTSFDILLFDAGPTLVADFTATR
jgi:hypothetical protein